MHCVSTDRYNNNNTERYQMYKDGNPAFHSHPFGQAWHDKSAAVTMSASTQVAKTNQNLKSNKHQ